MTRNAPHRGVWALWGVMLLVVGSILAPASATITEDINPLDYSVEVTILEDVGESDRGTVTVRVILDTGPASRAVPYDLAANETDMLVASFPGQVLSVTQVIINPAP